MVEQCGVLAECVGEERLAYLFHGRLVVMRGLGQRRCVIGRLGVVWLISE